MYVGVCLQNWSSATDTATRMPCHVVPRGPNPSALLPRPSCRLLPPSSYAPSLPPSLPPPLSLQNLPLAHLTATVAGFDASLRGVAGALAYALGDNSPIGGLSARKEAITAVKLGV